MQVNRLMLCDVLETDNAVMIVNTMQAQQIKFRLGNNVRALVRAEPTTCAEFVLRYLFERSLGVSPERAKEKALEGANVVREHGLEKAIT